LVDCLLWAFFEISKSGPNFWDTFFRGTINFDKNGLGTILRYFFTNTSGNLVTSKGSKNKRKLLKNDFRDLSGRFYLAEPYPGVAPPPLSKIRQN
jgi:hypothetical protein